MSIATDVLFRSPMIAPDRAQRCTVDAVLAAVERTLAAQHEARLSIVASRVRVDRLLKEAVESGRRFEEGEHRGK